MGHFVEILEHPALNKQEREFVGMKGRIVGRSSPAGASCVYLTDKREVMVPDVALRPIPKKNF